MIVSILKNWNKYWKVEKSVFDIYFNGAISKVQDTCEKHEVSENENENGDAYIFFFHLILHIIP